MKTNLSTLFFSLKIGVFVYVIDLNYYYLIHLGYDHFLFELIGLNLISLVFLFLAVRKLILSQKKETLLIAILLVVSLGVYIKLYTQGDPLFDWLRIKIGLNNALLLFSMLSTMFLFKNSIMKRIIQFFNNFFVKYTNEQFSNNDLLDEDMFIDSNSNEKTD